MKQKLLAAALAGVALTIAACNTTGPSRPTLVVFIADGSNIVRVGQTQQVRARLEFSDRDDEDVTTEVGWSARIVTGEPGYVHAQTGVLIAEAPGTLEAIATYGPLQATMGFTIIP